MYRVIAYLVKTTEAFCDDDVSAVSFLSGAPRSILYATSVWRWQRSRDPPTEHSHPPLKSRHFCPNKRVHLRVPAAKTA